jgi:hypothetical protein
LSRLWCQAEIIASKLPLRLPHFNIQWIGQQIRGGMFDIRPFDGQGFHSPSANRKSCVGLDSIIDPSTCNLTNPNDMRKILPLLLFAIKEFEEFLLWDASDAAYRCQTKTFGNGIHRMDDDPCRKDLPSGGISSGDIREVLRKLKNGVDVIHRNLADCSNRAAVDPGPLP